MYALCSYTCSYCGRLIETSFVTIGERHYHDRESQSGNLTEPSCYVLSRRGTESLLYDEHCVTGAAERRYSASGSRQPAQLESS
jgi:hypothetical protein